VNPYAWSRDSDAIVLVPVLLVAYVASLRAYPASRGRIVCAVAGLTLVFAALVTPLDAIALHYLLTAHLLQNVVLAEWAPGLVVLGVSPALAARLPSPHPLLALPVWLLTYFVWHLPWVYDAALRRPDSLLHLEHTSYFVAGLLLWWPVVHGRLSSGVKAAYLFGAFVLASPLGLLLALLPNPIYSFYKSAPRLWGLSPLTDQQVAGVTMAAEQAVVFFAAFTLYAARFLHEEALAT
jgi:cytochrome c oxidase assembly factor CtaG